MTGSELEYLKEAADRYGQMYMVDEIQGFVSNATQAQRAELALVYEEIALRDSSLAISKWINQCTADRQLISEKEFSFSQGVCGLFTLFSYFAKSGIPPFSSQRVVFVEEISKPDWSSLPAQLRYLVPHAEYFGADNLPVPLSSADKKKLTSIASQIRRNNDYSQINEWIMKYPFPAHQASALVYSMLGIMDENGLKFES